MQLKPFLLDAWLDQYEHGIEFNLAASTGPTWTVNDIVTAIKVGKNQTDAGLCPPMPFGPGGSAGSSGAIAVHRSSGTRGFAMPPRTHQRRFCWVFLA